MSIFAISLVWNAVVKPAGKKLVLHWFADKCQHDGSGVYGYMQTIAAAADLSPSMAQRYVGQLIDEGFISVTSHRKGGAPGTVTHYKVNVARLKALPQKKRTTRRPASPEATGSRSKVIHTESIAGRPKAEDDAHGCSPAAASVHETVLIDATQNVPTHPYNVCDTHESEKAKELGAALAKAGIKNVRQDKLISLVRCSASVDQVMSAVRDSASKDDPVSYGIAVILRRLSQAPDVIETAWDSTRTTIEQEGVRLGLGKWDKDAWPYKGGPSFAEYMRLVAAARLRSEEPNAKISQFGAAAGSRQKA